MNDIDLIARFRRVVYGDEFKRDLSVALKKLGQEAINRAVSGAKFELEKNADNCGFLTGCNVRFYKTRAMPNGYYLFIHFIINGKEVKLERLSLKKNSTY